MTLLADEFTCSPRWRRKRKCASGIPAVAEREIEFVPSGRKRRRCAWLSRKKRAPSSACRVSLSTGKRAPSENSSKRKGRGSLGLPQ